ncbi:MAG: SoxR reducing system RseC family protein [Muribaculaceae bacterium]|jgi:sigma-E factor negative regulatory protein RseC|nr:SoxR reducing system RseC family protein [Muribaculaceae bacterium]MBQ5723530.1 SoxR reducing system RseC family protein [Muribaculaceae bacterium]
MMKSVKAEQIIHLGKVLSVDSSVGSIEILLEDGGDCGSCPAAKLCNHGPKSENKVVVMSDDTFEVGEKVRVVGTEMMHRKAIVLALVCPCLLLIATMVMVYLLTLDESVAALSGLGLMLVFFIVLYVCRNRIAREFVFRVEKL